MNPSGVPVTNRLILVVLSLILICLILLVVRAYHTPASVAPSEPAVAEVEPAPTVKPPAPRPSKPIAFTPREAPTGEPAASAPQASLAPAADPAPPAAPAAPTAPAFPPPLYTPGGASPNAGRAATGSGGSKGSQPASVIFGKVLLQGTPPAEVPIALGPTCGRLNPNPVTTRHYVVGTNGGLGNVLVYVSSGVSQHPAPSHGALRLDQVGCIYEPYVFAVQTGEKFLVRNSDPEMHNVHILPRRNPERNFSQAVKGQVNTLSFDQPELFIRIKCDVHPWMFAYVSVIDHPYVDVSDANGNFVIPQGLPAGVYTVTAVHQKAGPLSQKITHAPGESRPLTFQFFVPDPTQAGNARPVRSPVGDEP